MSLITSESVHAAGADSSGCPTAKHGSPAREVHHDPNAIYALGSSNDESTRLQRQADELAPDSAALLDRVGLRPGHSAVDLGCGPRGVIELLYDRVSPGGRVVGIDADPSHVSMASDLVANLAMRDVDVVSADARHTGLQSGSFDLVHARTLLVTLPEPAEVLNEMVRLARPGGWVAKPDPRSTRPVTRAVRSGPTWSAPSVRTSCVWGWQMSGNLTSWMRPSVSTSTTPTRSSCLT